MMSPNEGMDAIVERHGRRFRTVGDMAYEVIREGIVTGVLAPGDPLSQRQLAATIGVSQNPVRAALLRLEARGLVKVEPYRGAVVRALTVGEAREIYQIRNALESLALQNAMLTTTSGRLARIDQLARKLNRVTDGEEYLRLRTEFFRELYDTASQPRLVALIEDLREEVARYTFERSVDYTRRPGDRDHRAVVPFLRAGDVQGALEWLRDHLRSACVALTDRLPLDD